MANVIPPLNFMIEVTTSGRSVAAGYISDATLRRAVLNSTISANYVAIDISKLVTSFEWSQQRNGGMSWSLKLTDPAGIFQWLNTSAAPWLTPDHNYMVDDASSAAVKAIEAVTNSISIPSIAIGGGALAAVPQGTGPAMINLDQSVLPVLFRNELQTRVNDIATRLDLTQYDKTVLIQEAALEVYAEAGLYDQYFQLTKRLVVTVQDGNGGSTILPSMVIKSYSFDRDGNGAVYHSLSGTDKSDLLTRHNIVMQTFHLTSPFDIVTAICQHIGIGLDWRLDKYLDCAGKTFLLREFQVQGETPIDLIKKIMDLYVASWYIDANDNLVIFDPLNSGGLTFNYADGTNIYKINASQSDADIINAVRVLRNTKSDMQLLGTCEGAIDFAKSALTPGQSTTYSTGTQTILGQNTDIFSGGSGDLLGVSGSGGLPYFRLISDTPQLDASTSATDPNNPGGIPSIASLGIGTADCSFTRTCPANIRIRVETLQDCWLRFVFLKTQQNGFCLFLDQPPLATTPEGTANTPFANFTMPTSVSYGGGNCVISASNQATGARIIFENTAKMYNNVYVISTQGQYKIRFYGPVYDTNANGQLIPIDPSFYLPIVQVVKDQQSINLYGLRFAPKDIESPLIPSDAQAAFMGQRYLLETGRMSRKVSIDIPFTYLPHPGDYVNLTDSIYGGQTSFLYDVESIKNSFTPNSAKSTIETITHLPFYG